VAYKPEIPDYLYIRYATVYEDDHIKLLIHSDTSAFVSEFRVLRSASSSGPYELIAVLPPATQSDIEFHDQKTFFDKQSYYYKVIALDSCGNEAVVSDHARTIYLTAVPKSNYTNVLEWNDYEGWTWASVREYNIFRRIDGILDPIPVSTMMAGSTFYIDDVSSYTVTEGKFSYYIQALEGPGTPDFGDTSLSNVAELMQYPKVFIPNAFSPKGYNELFRPVSVFVNQDDYIFSVYNRWGQLLYETRNTSEGWDGKYKGEYVPGGVYVYQVKFTTATGDPFERRGTVTVLY
jgi:gliding motility-associated-like protein